MFEAKFMFEKETKGAVRYKEVQEQGKLTALGTIYLRKNALPIPFPINLVVKVEAAD